MRGILRTLLSRSVPPVANASAEAFEVVPTELSRFVLTRLAPIVGVSPFPLNELMLMSAAVVRFRPTHIFDWGTHIGASARVFWETARRYDIPAEIHSIDLPDDATHVEHPGGDRGRLVRGRRGVYLHQGDGLDVALALCARLQPARPLFFVDGDHSYESVKRELAGIIGSVRSPTILLHDTFWQGPESGYNVGPARAISEIRDRFKVLELQLGLPGMTLLY